METRVENTEDRIRTFIAENFAEPPEGGYPRGQSLLETGVIDSMGVLTLVTWLEEAFGFVVDDGDVVPENLDSIANLVAYVERMLAEEAHAG
jgi:acyl carrier protein